VLEPAIKSFSITFLQVNIVPTSVTILVVRNNNLPASILARHNKTLPNDNPIYILVRIRNMIISN